MLWDSANAAPRYPVVMQQVGIGGEAVLSFRVSPDGVVEPGSVAVLSASNDAFVRGSVEAVSSWRFRTQIEQRPQEPVPVQVKLIFAHLGSCQGSPAQQHIGWGADNQLVTATCVERIHRDQVQGLK
ncbi:MAG TPA: TonB family protein [Gemmatimonadales bacterium]|nr:TonB family protein [Gemmatimonadales bacterium]